MHGAVVVARIDKGVWSTLLNIITRGISGGGGGGGGVG